jgi:hypothetical protein
MIKDIHGNVTIIMANNSNMTMESPLQLRHPLYTEDHQWSFFRCLLHRQPEA